MDHRSAAAGRGRLTWLPDSHGEPEGRSLLVLGADGDLTGRLLLPGLAALLASDWEPDRSLLVLGAGLGELDDRAWRSRVDDSFASGG